MRTIHVCVDFDVHKAGDHVEVEDQVACDAIAQGYAVPSVYAIAPAEPAVQAEEKALDPAVENRAIDGAPEVK